MFDGGGGFYNLFGKGGPAIYDESVLISQSPSFLNFIGSAVTVTASGNGVDVTISGGGVTAIGPIGSSPNANGMTLTGNTLNLEPASASFGGVVTTGTQTFAGAKTFNSAITVLAGSSTFSSTSITTTSTPFISLYASNVSTSLIPVRYSTALEYLGRGWDTGTVANVNHYFRDEIIPVSANPTTARHRYGYSTTGGAPTELWSYNQAGKIYIGGTPVFNAWLNIQAGTTSVAPIQWTSGALNTGGNILAGNDQFLTDKRYFTITTGLQVVEYAFLNTAGVSGQIASYTTNGRLTTGAVSAPLVLTAGALSITLADATHDGYVSSSDYNSFVSKISSAYDVPTTQAYGTTITPANSAGKIVSFGFTGSTGASTVDLTNVTALGAIVYVFDLDRISSTSNITIDSGGGSTITGQAGSAQTFVLNLDGGSVQLQLVAPNKWMVIQ